MLQGMGTMPYDEQAMKLFDKCFKIPIPHQNRVAGSSSLLYHEALQPGGTSKSVEVKLLRWCCMIEQVNQEMRARPRFLANTET